MLLGLLVTAQAHGQALPEMPATPEEPAQQSEEDALALGLLVDDALSRLLTTTRERGKHALAKKNYPAALRAFERALELDGGQIDVVWQLARLHALLGNRGEAERYYRLGLTLDPQDGELHLALAMLLAEEQDDPERLQEADTLLLRARQLGASPLNVALSRARVATALGRFDVAAKEYDAAVAAQPPDAKLMLELGDFHRDMGETEQALDWYRKIEAPKAMVQLSAQRIFELEVERQARHSGIRSSGSLTSQELQQLLTRARVAESQGKTELAESLLRDAIERSPDRAAPRAQLGRLLHKQGQLEEAERTLLQAVAMEAEPSAQRELGLLYLDQDPPSLPEAAFFLRRALRLRPNYFPLHLVVADVERKLGNLPEALDHVNHYLSQAPDQPEREAALQLQQELQSALGSDSATPPTPVEGESERLTTQALQRAQVHLGRGATTAALTELSRLPVPLQDTRVWNLRASILQAAGQRAEARDALRTSLQLDDSQADIHLQLGELLRLTGQLDEARQEFLSAERAGEAEAIYALAQLDASGGDSPFAALTDITEILPLWSARDRLGRYLAMASDARPRHNNAEALRHDVEQRLTRVYATYGSLLLFGLGLVFALRRRRLFGATLADLLSERPEATAEVQRILSAIRHEVLKHNTLMLASVAGRLQRGQPPGDQGTHLARAVSGTETEPGAAERLSDYADELNAIARAYEVRLNLWYRDPTLSPLLHGMRRLARLCPAILRAGRRSRNYRRRLGKRLHALHEVLNVEGYEALQQMLLELRSFELDEDVLHSVFERVRSEPALAERPIRELELFVSDDALPCALQLPRSAFTDILVNLLRNAAQASLSEGLHPVQLAIGVARDEDPITGLSRCMVAVCDNAGETLDTQKLRSAYIERGLGLTADLVSRHDGELSVQVGAYGYRKAVMLFLPCRTEDSLGP